MLGFLDFFLSLSHLEHCALRCQMTLSYLPREVRPKCWAHCGQPESDIKAAGPAMSATATRFLPRTNPNDEKKLKPLFPLAVEFPIRTSTR